MWLWRLVWNSMSDFLFFKYILSPTCPAGFAWVLHLSIIFQEMLRNKWFSVMSSTSRYLPSLHIILQFHRKKIYKQEEADCNSVACKCPCWATPSSGHPPMQSTWHLLKDAAGLGQPLFCNEISNVWRQPIRFNDSFQTFVQRRHDVQHITGRVTDWYSNLSSSVEQTAAHFHGVDHNSCIRKGQT